MEKRFDYTTFKFYESENIIAKIFHYARERAKNIEKWRKIKNQQSRLISRPSIRGRVRMDGIMGEFLNKNVELIKTFSARREAREKTSQLRLWYINFLHSMMILYFLDATYAI